MKACPAGWHLPSREEFKYLADFAGGDEAGKYLKTKSGWLYNGKPNNGEDKYGFSALPGGGGKTGMTNKEFYNVNNDGFWWSSSVSLEYKGRSTADYAYYGAITSGRYPRPDEFSILSVRLGSLFSVRCLKSDADAEAAKAEGAEAVAKEDAIAKKTADSIAAIAAAKKTADSIAAATAAAAAAAKKVSFADARDKKNYKSIKIDSQTWMAENLNYAAEGSKCYENNESNCQKWGRLYNWETAMKVCPKGWHLPSENEFEVLRKAVGDGANIKLKAINGWDYNNGTDIFGFSALPGGGVNSMWPNKFNDGGQYGYWWSSTVNPGRGGQSNAWVIGSAEIGGRIKEISDFYSVRCIKD